MSFKINFEALRQEGLQLLFEALERGFKNFQIDFYLVGAIARDTWLANRGINPIGTKDVDLGVYVSSTEEYAKLRQYLCDKEGFNITANNQFVLFSPDGLQVDLLPFGEIETEGKVMMEGKGLANIDVDGFLEVYEHGTDSVEFSEDISFKVCTLPGIVILKLIAFDDRPEHRQKDIKDIALILKHYFDLESDIIYDQHNDLFEDDRDLPNIGARVLGRQMKKIIERSQELEKRITRILKDEIDSPEKSKVAELMIAGTDSSVETAIETLMEILAGIKDKKM